MEPVLDELTLVPCGEWSIPERLRIFAEFLLALDSLGSAKILRSVEDAPDRQISNGRGLRHWCFDTAVDRDVGRLIANRLSSQPPYINGRKGLLAQYEGEKAVEANVGSVIVYGLGFAALTDRIVVGLISAAIPNSSRVSVTVTHCDDNDTHIKNIDVLRLINKRDVFDHDSEIRDIIDSYLSNGPKLLERACDVFPFISFGPKAIKQINVLTGNEHYFRQTIRHLRALNIAVQGWSPGMTYAPQGVNWSVESQATLEDGNLGPLRDFPSPSGYPEARWSYHTKLASGIRLYYRFENSGKGPIVLIGYLGKHLPTQKFR